MYKKSSQGNRGATLLIAVLMTSVILAVGMGIYERTYKSLVFSSYWKQTQEAFAAADAGLECVLYLKFNPGVTPQQCFGKDVVFNATNDFLLPISIGNSGGLSCAVVHVDFNTTLNQVTYIESRGYNDECTSVSPRRVERGLKVVFNIL